MATCDTQLFGKALKNIKLKLKKVPYHLYISAEVSLKEELWWPALGISVLQRTKKRAKFKVSLNGGILFQKINKKSGHTAR